MNIRLIRMSALVIAMGVAGLATAAPQDAAGHASVRAALDLDHDGAIDRGEAASHPRLARHFDRLDRDGDGMLEKSERTRHKGRRHRGHHDHRGDGAAIRLDADGDGRISTIEAAKSAWGKRFGEVDRNRDGYLVRSELAVAAERRRSEFAVKRKQRFDARFAAADGNRDGRLSRAEVEAKWPRRTRSFNWLDENRDGQLERADLMPRRSR